MGILNQVLGAARRSGAGRSGGPRTRPAAGRRRAGTSGGSASGSGLVSGVLRSLRGGRRRL